MGKAAQHTLCALLFLMFLVSSAAAGSRVALIVGNADYEHAGTLANPLNDADAVAAMFKKAGFDVVDERKNVGSVEFKRALRDLMNSAIKADIAVVYLSGHGIEASGTNYLVPVDAKLVSDYDTDDEAIPLDRVIAALQPAQKLRLIILDACRDNPFFASGQRQFTIRAVAKGLTPVEPAGVDTLIAYAAKAGSISYDGTGPNSPFTASLVKNLAEPGLDIRIAFGRIRDEVMAATSNRQEPFLYGSLGGATISLVPAPADANEHGTVGDGTSIQSDYLIAERIGTREAWEAFLGAHGSGIYADLARAQLSKLKSSGSVAGIAVVPTQPSPPGLPNGADGAAKAEACKRDAERLARLRANPTIEEGERLARELACPELRPQVARLLESLGKNGINASGFGVGAAAPSTPPKDNPGTGGTYTKDQICKRDAERLARLRANPTVEEGARFASELACKELGPQLARLLESLGVAPPTSLVPPLAAPSPQVPQRSGESEQQAAAAACAREAEQLAHLRTSPDREKLIRFLHGLACERLRAQALRLLESVGG